MKYLTKGLNAPQKKSCGTFVRNLCRVITSLNTLELGAPMNRLFKLLLTLLLPLLCLGVYQAYAQTTHQVVVFSANWCASCRDVVPIVEEIAGQKGIKVNVVDVDDPSTPSVVRSLGLKVPQGDLPQVFSNHQGQWQSVFDGSDYMYGETELVRSSIMEHLSP